MAPGVSKEDFIVMDGTEISKKNAKYMEGLEFVKNGDTGGIGPGYNVLNINAVNAHMGDNPAPWQGVQFRDGRTGQQQRNQKSGMGGTI